ncbi:MAG TPA: cytochrome c [Burkholderiales bacterium]|nr:cytochrome c [Burkholderiales bacterium]
MKTTIKHMAGAFCGALAIAAAIPHSLADDELPPFPKELLNQPEQIEKGHQVFESICKFCHGKTAYPGKAPKLNPSRYTPEFVYDRVTNGFRGMPSWKEQYTEEERKAVTVFIMSKEFSN